MSAVIPRPVIQIAYFGTDVRASAARMARAFGAGPFFVLDHIDLAWAEHRGRRCDFVHSSAYGQWGDEMLELVQQDVEGPSPFRDLFGPGEQGLHHVATWVESLDAAISDYAEIGFPLATRAETRTGTEFAFVDAVATLGHMIEIYEPSDALVGFYAFVREASLDWDGSDPVRAIV